MNILETKSLTKTYGTGETAVHALKGIDLTVKKGEFAAIVGTSGSGKSTLLHLIGGLDTPTFGQVIVDSQDLGTMTDEQLTIFRRRNIGFVFQAYNLIPMLNVWENIVLPVKLDGKTPEKSYLAEIIDTLGLKDLQNRLPNALSGGQQQRVAIARALAAKPAVLLADEPTGNLDSRTSQDVLGLLKMTGERFHQTIVMITHNEEIAQLADSILHLEDGRIVSDTRQASSHAVPAAQNGKDFTTLLFTTLFTGANSMFLTKLEADKKLYLTTAHATIQDLTDAEAKQAEEAFWLCDFVEYYGKDRLVGIVQDERLYSMLELHSGNDYAAENRLIRLSAGSFPKAADEIALSTQVLDALGIPHELGASVTCSVLHSENGEAQKETFRLCGYWQGDPTDLWQLGWVSEEYADRTVPVSTADQIASGNVFGSWNYAVWYTHPRKLVKYTAALNEISELGNCGRHGDGFQENPAFLSAYGFEEGGMSPVSVAALALLIVLAGYLIIYNIFSISVKNDIRAYGLLKNVGTTGRQLKKIVRMQALFLCAVGIPIGIPAGYAIGLLFAPALNASLTDQAPIVVTSAHPLIFLASALFALLTVYLSSLQACRTVSRLSPAEALRMAENEQTARKTKRNLSASWQGMALQNVLRTWKRGVIVMFSIALSLATLYYINLMLKNLNFESYSGIYVAADFQLDKLPSSLDYADLNAITPEIQHTLDVCPYSERTGYICLSKEKLLMTEHLRELFENITQKYLPEWSGDTGKIWDDAESSGQLPLYYMGINEAAFDMLSFNETFCTWNEFCDGSHCIVRSPKRYVEEYDGYYNRGDTFSVAFADGTQKDYQALGKADIPFPLDFPYSYLTGVLILVPAEEYLARTGNPNAMRAAIDAIPGQERSLEMYLEDTVLAKDSTLQMKSILTLQKTFDNYLNKYRMIGGLLVLVLAFIGVMNFFNTTATSILSRRRELALLEAVGMTKRQIQKMLIAEGFVYLAGAFVMALMITCFFAGNTLRLSPATQISRISLPALLSLLPLFLIAFGIPKWQFQKAGKEHLAELLK